MRREVDTGRNPKIGRLNPIDEDRAREIIRTVTGETADSVDVEAGPLVGFGLRARTDSGMHRYLFVGDAHTPPTGWTTARLREVCWLEGCWQKIDPAAPTICDAETPTVPVWRVCHQHHRHWKVIPLHA
jgi:hypothetical protein